MSEGCFFNDIIDTRRQDQAEVLYGVSGELAKGTVLRTSG